MAAGRFVVGKVKDLPPGHSRSVRVEGRRVALFNEGGRLYAVDEACPHMGADLSNGNLRDGTLSCSWHGWRFDIASGKGLTKTWARLKTHLLQKEGEDLVLEIREAFAENRGEAENPPSAGGEPS